MNAPLSRSAACALARAEVEIVLHSTPAYGPRQWAVRRYDEQAHAYRTSSPGTYARCMTLQAELRITHAALAMGYDDDQAARFAARFASTYPAGRWQDWTPTKPASTALDAQKHAQERTR